MAWVFSVGPDWSISSRAPFGAVPPTGTLTSPGSGAIGHDSEGSPLTVARLSMVALAISKNVDGKFGVGSETLSRATTCRD